MCQKQRSYSLQKTAAGAKPKGSVTQKAVQNKRQVCCFPQKAPSKPQPQQQEIQTTPQSMVLQGGDLYSPFTASDATPPKSVLCSASPQAAGG